MLLQKIVEQSIHYKVGQLLIHRGACITKMAVLIQYGAGINKLGQELLQSGEVNLLQSGSFIIAK